MCSFSEKYRCEPHHFLPPLVSRPFDLAILSQGQYFLNTESGQGIHTQSLDV